MVYTYDDCDCGATEQPFLLGPIPLSWYKYIEKTLYVESIYAVRPLSVLPQHMFIIFVEER